MGDAPTETPSPPDRLLLIEGQVRVLRSALSGSRYEWLVEADGQAQLRVATFYYAGWRLIVDGDLREPAVHNPYGLMDFTLDGGAHEVVVEFGLTPLRTWAAVMSALAATAGVVALLWPAMRARGRVRA